MLQPPSAATLTFARSIVSATSAVFVLSLSHAALAQQSPASTEGATAAGPVQPGTPGRLTPPTVDECLAAHREAQSLRKQYRLRESRELLSDCSNDACPGPVKRDCMRWIDDVAMQMPSVVFRVDSGDGTTPNKVKVYADDELLFENLPTRAVDLNPGTYRFRFVLENGQSVAQNVVLGEGEKFKSVAVRFEPMHKPGADKGGTLPGGSAGTGVPSASTESMSQQDRPVPLSTYIFAGVGAAAAINFGVWAIWSESLRKELSRECAPNCEQEFIDRVRTRGYVADISLGVSVASFATATVLYFTRPSVSLPVKVDIGVLPGGGFAGSVLKEF